MMARRALVILGGAIVLLAPFGGGGREPFAMLILHLLALLYVLVGSMHWIGGEMRLTGMGSARVVPGLVAAGLLLASIASLRADDALAAGLGFLDLALPVALLATALAGDSDRRRLGYLRNLVVASTTLQAVVALVRGWDGSPAAAAALFENSNHLAAWLNIGLLLCVSTAESNRSAGRIRASWGWVALGLLHMVTVARLSSRGALLALALSFALFVAIRAGSWSRRTRVVIGLVLLLASAVGTVSLVRRFTAAEDPYRYHRFAIWEASLGMLAERPFLGFGPGMFKHEAGNYNFPLDASPVRYGRTFSSAHSAILSVAVEAGAPAALLFLAATCLTIVLLLRSRGDPDQGGIPSAVGLALFSLVVHAVVEDLHHRPALLLVPALLAGAALAAATRGRQGAAGDALPVARPEGRGALRAGTVALIACAAWGAVILPYLAHREAEAARSLDRAGLQRMERAASLNRLHPEYRNDLAMAMLNLGPIDADRYAAASRHLVEARRLKPNDYRFPLLLARLEARVGEPIFGDVGAAGRANDLYRESARLSPTDPRPLLEWGGHLSSTGSPREAIEVLESALRREPHFLRAAALKISVLLDLGDLERARSAFLLLASARDELSGYRPDSPYAREIVRLDPEEWVGLQAALDSVRDPDGLPSNR